MTGTEQPGDQVGPAVRASDAERERTVARLRDAAAEGRLTLEELADRTGAAYEATARGELERIVADLPAAPPRPPAAPPRRTFVGVMGGDSVKLPEGAPPPDAPVVRIRSFNLMGGNSIRPPRRERRKK